AGPQYGASSRSDRIGGNQRSICRTGRALSETGQTQRPGLRKTGCVYVCERERLCICEFVQIISHVYWPLEILASLFICLVPFLCS
ncbi:hypothetical protein cypCar_00036492, partial [Cyprinus carpio]